MNGGNVIQVNQREYKEALRYLEKMQKSLEPKWIKSTIRRNSNPIVEEMRQASHSVKLMAMIGATTAKKWAGRLGVRIGVIKNDPVRFPKISAQGLAAILEYGTAERFRILKRMGFVVGRVSTGVMPSLPFLRPAWFRGRGAMMNKVEKAIKKRVP